MRRGSHGSKKSQELSNEILIQKGENLTRNERQGNNVAYFLLYNLVFHQDDKKKKIKKQSKNRLRRISPCPSLSSSSSRFSSSESEEEDQETKWFHIVSNEN